MRDHVCKKEHYLKLRRHPRRVFFSRQKGRRRRLPAQQESPSPSVTQTLQKAPEAGDPHEEEEDARPSRPPTAPPAPPNPTKVTWSQPPSFTTKAREPDGGHRVRGIESREVQGGGDPRSVALKRGRRGSAAGSWTHRTRPNRSEQTQNSHLAQPRSRPLLRPVAQ